MNRAIARLGRFLAGIAVALLAVLIAESITSEDADAQQGKPPTMHEFRVERPVKVDPSLDWLSEYRQPFIYQLWWQEIAACEGLPVPWEKVRRVQFFQVNAPSFLPKDVGAVVYAITYGDSRPDSIRARVPTPPLGRFDSQVYIANTLIWNRAIVEHEALHLLRMWAGDPFWYDHSDVYYGARCRVPASGEPPVDQ